MLILQKVGSGDTCERGTRSFALTLTIHPFLHVNERSEISVGHRHENQDTAYLLKTKPGELMIHVRTKPIYRRWLSHRGLFTAENAS